MTDRHHPDDKIEDARDPMPLAERLLQLLDECLQPENRKAFRLSVPSPDAQTSSQASPCTSHQFQVPSTDAHSASHLVLRGLLLFVLDCVSLEHQLCRQRLNVELVGQGGG